MFTDVHLLYAEYRIRIRQNQRLAVKFTRLRLKFLAVLPVLKQFAERSASILDVEDGDPVLLLTYDYKKFI